MAVNACIAEGLSAKCYCQYFHPQGLKMLNDLKDKRVLITGASTGIGAAAALAFGQLGARVAVHFNKHGDAAEAVCAAIIKTGGKAISVGGDLAAKGVARQVVEESAAGLGGLDILVNNAGSLISRRPFLEIDRQLYDDVMDLNVLPVIEASQAAVPHMVKAGAGAIVNVGSIAGNDGGGPGSGHYASAKAYIHNLTRHMARDLAAKNIRVNAIAPGVIETAFHAATPPERMEAMRKAVPLGRAGRPEDCAGPIIFLSSTSMGGYITGQILHVNGGQLMP
jgi:3-oxoacyl-[acyl-carrier protein] reductase